MDYPEFIRQIQRDFERDFPQAEAVTLTSILKNNNVTLEGITVRFKDLNISPTIYLEPFYKELETESYETVYGELLKAYKNSMCQDDYDISFYSDYERVRSRLCFKLISYERNQRLLEELPHIRLMNLAKIFYYYLDCQDESASITVRRDHMEKWGVTVEDLDADAMKNTPALLPFKLMNLYDIVLNKFKASCQEDLPPDFLYSLPDMGIKVLSNTASHHGAATLIYPGLMDRMWREIGQNFFIIPSSIHELILIPEDQASSPEDLDTTIDMVNKTELDPTEYLSDHCYYYDGIQKTLQLGQETKTCT